MERNIFTELEPFRSSEENSHISIEPMWVEDIPWLTQDQIALLFGKERSVVTKHINKVFGEEELTKIRNVQKMHIPNSDKPVTYYSLDVILAVGYRTNSKRAIEFRNWATHILKQYLLKGYAMNEMKLRSDLINRQEAFDTIRKLTNNETLESLSDHESKDVLHLISNYMQSFLWLHQFDKGALTDVHGKEEHIYEISHEEAYLEIQTLKTELINRQEASDYFGRERDNAFKGILLHISAQYFGQYVYPSIEERAANLLYLIIKDHPFVDGNKRIGAFLFVRFLDRNKHLWNDGGQLKINDNALTILAILVAQSKPEDKELFIRLIALLITAR